LLGRFAVQVGDDAMSCLRSARAESLLAGLLLHRDVPVSRRRLASMLWPDSSEAQARTNLRHLLHTLRGELPGADQHLEITARAVRWRREPHVRLDVADFEELLDAPAADAAARRTALRAAVALYGGDLLDGCDDEWLREERERLRRRLDEALTELADLCAALGELDEAVTAAERLLQDDPLREDAYRTLIRLHAARGDGAAAVRAYHRCATTLDHELGVEPSPATQRTYRELLTSRAGEVSPPPRLVPRPPLVGRKAERAALVAAWRAAAAGCARLVLVTGEAGIGKTRLVEELRGWCARHGATTAEARCYAAEGPLAYGPVVDWLRAPGLAAAVNRLDGSRLSELARVLPELLDTHRDLAAPQPLPADEHRRRLFDAVTAAVLAARPPVLLVVDDLPHADRETCQLLHYLLRARPAAPVLVAATARAEDLEPARPLRDLLDGAREHGRLTEVVLHPLTASESAALAERLSGTRPDEGDAARLHRETEGNPLFIVEAVRAGEVSARVQSVIAARLARLSPPACEVVGVAAAIGREFTLDVLAAASELDEDALVGGLDELWQRRIVRDRGAAGYDFSHDRIRQVAYAALGPARRQRLHARIAAALERVHAASPGPVSARIAAHHERAGAVAPAITWYRRAAEAAQLLHASARSLELLERALALVGSLAPSRQRDGTELDLRIATLVPLLPLTGFASPAMTAALDRAGELVHALGVPAGPPLLRALALEALTRSDFAAATRHGQLLRAAGERTGDVVLLVEAAYVLGIAAFWQADLEEARRHFELAVERYRPRDRVAHLTHYGQDPKAVCLGRLACTLWFLGCPTEARRASAAALAWSETIAHPFSRGVALTFAIVLAIDMGDEAQVRGLVREFAQTAGDGMHAYVAAAFTGYVSVLDGDTDAGLAAVAAAVRRSAVAPLAPGQHAVMQRLQLAASLAAGDRDSALAAAERLLHMGGPARLWAPEARRVRGALAERTRNGD
jgi:DNA-binding SARP family transcriptional activator